MKKIFKLSLEILNIVILIFLLSGCKSLGSEKASIEQKLNTEISYVDGELISILNKLNNIDYSRYKVTAKEVKNEESSSGSSQGEGSSGGQSSEGSGDSNANGQSSEGSSQQKSSSSQENSKIFSMERNNILGNDAEISWDELKSNIENLYSTWTVVALDLKEIGVSNEQLTEFSKNIDRVAISVENEDEVGTMENVINLYSFLPKFVDKFAEEKEVNVIYSKYNLLICYKYAASEDWEQLRNSITDLKMSFSNVVNKKDEYSGKNVNIESASVIINDMEDSSEIEEKDVFFLKYKSLMEELNIITDV